MFSGIIHMVSKQPALSACSSSDDSCQVSSACESTILRVSFAGNLTLRLSDLGVPCAHSRRKVKLVLCLFINIETHSILATGFSKAFPGIKPHLLTLSTNFQIPIYRDILLALGICSVSKKSCSNILKAGSGSAITIVVGGAAESLSARPGTADLTLRRRCVVRTFCQK